MQCRKSVSESESGDVEMKIKAAFNNYLCEVVFANYADNENTAIQLIGVEDTSYQGELIATASVNTSDKLGSGEVAIKTWSENEGIDIALVNAGVIKPALKYIIPTGFVAAGVYELTDEAIQNIKQEPASSANDTSH